MNIYFDLTITQEGVLQIEDQTQAFNEYLPEDSDFYVTPGRFKYSETYTINVIKYASTSGVKVLKTLITPHVDNDIVFCDEAYYTFLQDGHYIIDHLVIPNIDCIQNRINLEDYDRVYTTDGINFYKYVEGSLEECTIEELVESNEYRTTISKASKEIFSLYKLNNMYLNLCNKYLHKMLLNICTKEIRDFEFDLIWLSLNAIKYNVDFGLLNKALQLLEEIYKCTGISKLANHNLNIENNYGCNCCL